MNPADTPSHSHLLRSKRTRNTSGPDDSIKLPATKKRRSALRRDTFEPLADASINELAGRTQTDTQSNGSAIEPVQKPSSRSTSRTRDLTLRGGKKTEKRSEKGSGLLTLSTNDFYTVSQLPALPDQIRTRPTVAYSCVISPENDYVLALTHTDALLWSYSANTATPTSRELLSFKLPFPPAITEDPLPLASFTAKSANGEPGIVVVSPKWGKIVYWETLSSASSYAPSQSSNGVQGSIPGMFHGEVVKDLVSAEPAGFILSLASGRVAQLTIRDQVGRPAIGVQFMRKSTVSSVRGGIFGSIRSVFGADRRKGIAVARPGRIARAQRDVVVCTEDGELEFWTNNLLTGNHLSRTANVKDSILTGLESQVDKEKLQQPVQFKVVDFSLASTPSSHDLIRSHDTNSYLLTFLVALTSQAQSNYYLVETTVAEDATQIRVVHPIRCYTHDIAEENSFRPKICIPPSSTTAFVIFEKAVVILSLAKISESPSSQLVAEKSDLPIPFQDCIRLENNNVYQVINFIGEDDESGPSCILAIQGFGITRVVSHLSNDDEIDLDDIVTQPSAKTRIEQAIFFGTKKANPLDLCRSFRTAYSTQEVRQAILNISREIVKSTSKHISKSSSSIADHLQQRARALQDLIEYSLKTYQDCLGRADRFMLLWNAEKIATAQALWKAQETIQSTYPRSDDREMTYLNFALLALSENRQKYPKPEKGETDHVRHWLIHSVNEISRLLVELQDSMHELPEMNMNDPRVICDYFLEGTELWTTAFQAAFRFREDNAAVYGLGNETYDRGVLRAGYPASLPPAWTSNPEQVNHGQDYVRDVCIFLSEWWTYSPSQQNGSTNPKTKKSKQMPMNIDGEPYDAPSKPLLVKLADRLPLQVDLVNRIVWEANIQHRTQVTATDLPQEQKDRQLQELDVELRQITNQSITSIAQFNRDGSLALAEAEKDSNLLVELNLLYLADLSRTLKAHPEDEKAIRQKIRAVQDHVETYFDQFGNDWAYSHFSSMIERGELGRLVGEGQIDGGRKQPYLSWFFETCAKHDIHLGKVAWINDIVGENKYDAACQTLEKVASIEESDIWSKKTELSLAKLAGLAALENEGLAVKETKIGNITDELDYLQIIESLAFHINAPLFDAIDDEGAIQLAVERFIPKSITTNKKAQQTRKYLSETLYKLVTNQTVSLHELVDALTLLDLGILEVQEIETDVDDISGAEFPYALQAIDLAPAKEADDQQKEELKKIVWRRLLIRDNWVDINQTAGKSDKQVKEIMQRTVLFTTLLDLYRRAEIEKTDAQIPSIDEIMENPGSGKAKGDNTSPATEKLSEEDKTEIAQLKKYVDKARLKEHFSGLVTEARDELRRFQDAEGETIAAELIPNGQVNGNHS